MALASENLTVPRGRVLFAEFMPGTRAPRDDIRWLGNCPEFTLSRDSSELNHFGSTGGLRTMDASIPLGGDFGGTLTTDDINPENVRYWFMGTNQTVSVSAKTSVVQTIENVKKGAMYQIGRTEQNPLGAKRLSTVAITASPGGTAYQEFRDYEVELASGLITITTGGTIPEDGDITVTYSAPAYTYNEVRSGSKVIEGEMKFVSDNPYGPNRELVIPRVSFAPNGDLSFLTDPESPAWQTLSFSLKVLQKGNLPLVINADGLPATNDASGTV